MDNSFRDNNECDTLSYKNTEANKNNKDNEIVRTPRTKRISSPKWKYKNSGFAQIKFSMVEDLKKTNDDDNMIISPKCRKASMPENIRKEVKKIEKRDSDIRPQKKKERANKKRKKEKKMD